MHRACAIGQCLVCADGAAKTCLQYGLQPEAIVGDLDSLDLEVRNQFSASRILDVSDQETTDGEKAVHHCLQSGFNRLILLGALGKRADHALYNIGLLKRFQHPAVSIVIWTAEDEIRLISQTTVLTGSPGDRISLLPVFGRVEGVITEGLRYPLTGQSLEFGRFCSISNEFSAGTARIQFKEGDLLVIRPRTMAMGGT